MRAVLTPLMETCVYSPVQQLIPSLGVALSPLRTLQIAGFAAVFALFLACGLAFYSLTATTKALQGFQAMYYISSFFAQFVNATTFLLVSSHLPMDPYFPCTICDMPSIREQCGQMSGKPIFSCWVPTPFFTVLSTFYLS